jgi:hypothetical protein
MVSKLHAEIFEGDDQLMVRDLGSTNGTFVNLEPLASSSALSDGDLLHFADQECRLVSVKLEDQPVATLLTGLSGLRKLGRSAPELRELLENRAVTALFQPIVDHDEEILGYEQLGRGAWTSLPESPVELFAIAAHLDLECELSRTLASRRSTGSGPVARHPRGLRQHSPARDHPTRPAHRESPEGREDQAPR